MEIHVVGTLSVPTGGSPGQVLTQTASGPAWQAGGGGGTGSVDEDQVQSIVNTMLVEGTNVTLNRNPAGDVITIAVTGLTKTAVGLGSVDNTSDVNKPLSTAATTALVGKADSVHSHTALEISNASTVGRSILTAADAAAVRTATGAAATVHTHAAADISNSTTVGRSVLTAADVAAARTAIGAGTSSLALGTTSTTAAAGNHNHDTRYMDIAAGSNMPMVIFGAGPRNIPGTSTPVPVGQVVMWIHETQPPFMSGIDIWFQKEDPAVPVAPDMVIVGSAAVSPSAISTTQTITVPAATQAGDLILLFISQPGGTSTTTVTGLSGLTLHKERKLSGNSAYVYQRQTALSTDAGKVITMTSSASLYVTSVLVVIRGATNIIDSAINDSLGGTSSTPETPPLITTAQAFELQFLTRTGANIAGLPAGAPVSVTKIAEAITTVTDGGASAAAVGRTTLAAQSAQSSLGGDTWTQGNSGFTAWTIALGVPA